MRPPIQWLTRPGGGASDRGAARLCDLCHGQDLVGWNSHHDTPRFRSGRARLGIVAQTIVSSLLGRGYVGCGTAPAHGHESRAPRRSRWRSATAISPSVLKPAGRRPDRARSWKRSHARRPTARWRRRTIVRHDAERAEEHGHGQDRQDGQGRPGPRTPVTGLRGARAPASPRAWTEIGGCPVGIARKTLAGPGQDHRQLPGTNDEEHRQRGEV